ncbi:RES family NAD+ phosphorylase [Erwinia sorbitola]|uniref:RES domain-containing protein n=1 Tax=Erwinia sorbitola TaxID=2681984 RepID=A0A6I6EUQ1_9GAMM|nr:RES family NAD+ phosphorylase [Erwinia sorbitola]MTD26723.1 RES domain-containing protein [Erwinia sorbitola]QGU88292.1 RES domain-containing protein [Erwinia sorbitola]
MAKESSTEKGFSTLLPPGASVDINIRRLPAGLCLYRIHRQQFAGDSFNNTVTGNARFSPIFDRQGNVIPTLYAGDTTKVALCEVIFHDMDISQSAIVYPVSELNAFRHSQLVTAAPLLLASLDLPSLIKMRAGKKLIHSDASDYQITRQWAEAIHYQYPQVHGLTWPSRQHEGDAWLFFGDRINGELQLNGRGTQQLTRYPVVGELLSLADRMGIYLEE